MTYDRCASFNIILNNWSSLLRWRTSLKLETSKPFVVATNGCFDILHVGHIEMLEAAATFGTHLVVGLNSDDSVRRLKGRNRPINPQQHRKRVLEALRCVSKVHIFNEPDATRFLIAANPNLYIKAGDYTLDNMNRDERNVLEKMGSMIFFTDFIKGVSTSNIIRKLHE